VQFLKVDALVRSSFAAYSDEDDVAISIEAIKNISKFI
jgi:selenocysteine lyase/cysteine desulfurase